MSTTQQDKPGGKSRRRNRKAEPRGRPPDQAQGTTLDQQIDHRVGTAAAPTDPVASSEARTEPASVEASASANVPLIGEAAPTVAPALDAAAPAQSGPIGMQTIANAYRSYARKSLQQTGCLAEKLMAARSIDKVIEAQSEFTRQACASLVAEALNIGELHNRLANQTFRSWQRFAMGAAGK